jgi:hypothetical protein
VFLSVFACVSGFLALLNVADAIRTIGTWDAYVLFVLPSLRLAAALIIALAAHRYYRWQGRDGVKFCGVVALFAAGLTAASYLSRVSLLPWGAALGAAVLAGALIVFAARFPRAVQG